MKYLSVFIIAFFMMSFTPIASAQQDAITKYFNKYMEDDRFTVVYISPKMFELFGKLDLDLGDETAQDVLRIAKDLKSLRILTAEENSDQLYKEAKKMISTKEYEILMTVRDKNEDNVEFLIKDEGDIVKELLLMVGGGNDFVMMSFVGNIDLKDISDLANKYKKEGEAKSKSSERKSY